MFRFVVASAVVVVVCMAATGMNAQDVKNGKKVYEEYCKTCHMANGEGMAKVYPPIAKSDYIVKTPTEILIREVVFGKSGKVTVNGKEYNGVMAPLPSKYKDKDIADVMTYIFTNFGNSKGKVTVKDVAAAKKKGKVK